MNYWPVTFTDDEDKGTVHEYVPGSDRLTLCNEVLSSDHGVVSAFSDKSNCNACFVAHGNPVTVGRFTISIICEQLEGEPMKQWQVALLDDSNGQARRLLAVSQAHAVDQARTAVRYACDVDNVDDLWLKGLVSDEWQTA